MVPGVLGARRSMRWDLVSFWSGIWLSQPPLRPRGLDLGSKSFRPDGLSYSREPTMAA
jgi:hypothetical protein